MLKKKVSGREAIQRLIEQFLTAEAAKFTSGSLNGGKKAQKCQKKRFPPLRGAGG
jgi:hypothetical protein